jgi:hypothetical protein
LNEYQVLILEGCHRLQASFESHQDVGMIFPVVEISVEKIGKLLKNFPCSAHESYDVAENVKFMK